MNGQPKTVDLQSNALFEERYSKECRRINKFMIWLMLAQWIAGIGFAVFFSPLTWIGQSYEWHIHVWAAVLLGGAISSIAILWVKSFPDSKHSRHVIAVCQMLWAALLIHLSGGRIETHFHVFASLAILSIYRDWKILITATVVVAVDHFVRGVFYPLSAFGIVAESPYRWIEHAAWVLFEVSFLVPGCMRLRNELRELCEQKTEIEQAKKNVEIKVAERTHDLTMAIRRLAQKTAEAEKLALVARYTDNAVVITDAESKIEWVNEGYTRITGYKLKEVQGKRTAEFQHGPQTDSETISRMQTALKNKTGFDAEIVNYKKNGRPYWLSIEVRPILDEYGVVSRFIAMQSDVTQRKAMETSLASAEAKLRSLVNNVPGAFYRCQAAEPRAMHFMSNAIADMTGYKPDDFVKSKLVAKADIVHPDDRQQLAAAISEATTNSGDFEFEYRLIDRAKNIKWVQERGQCLRDDDGTLVIDGMIFDIADRKQAEAELASKVEIIENSLNEVYIFDSSTLNFRYVNHGGCTNTGYTLDELKQLTPLDIKPDFSLVSFRKMMEPLEIGIEEQLVFQTQHLRKNGSRYIAEIRLQKSRYQDEDVFLAMILDISDRVEAESKNNQLQKELLDASRKAGMADVATGVLHNVGNILNSVNVSASLIQKRIANSALANLEKAKGLISENEASFADFVLNDDRGKKLPNYICKVTNALASEQRQVMDEFEDLLKNVEHIKDIVSVQQSMAKSNGVNQRLSAEEIISDVLAATKSSLANHQIQVVQEIDETLPQLNSDKHKILQILINFVSNAKDSLVEHNTKNATIKLLVEKKDDFAVFKVIDNGVGIPVDGISKVFQHGFTTKRDGHGFGLHSSANAATELGGSVTVSSVGIGQGACFTLAIPDGSATVKEVATANS